MVLDQIKAQRGNQRRQHLCPLWFPLLITTSAQHQSALLLKERDLGSLQGYRMKLQPFFVYVLGERAKSCHVHENDLRSEQVKRA